MKRPVSLGPPADDCDADLRLRLGMALFSHLPFTNATSLLRGLLRPAGRKPLTLPAAPSKTLRHMAAATAFPRNRKGSRESLQGGAPCESTTWRLSWRQ